MRHTTSFTLLFVTALALNGCATDEPIGATHDEIASANGSTWPDGVGTMQIEAFPAFGNINPYSPPNLHNCHAVLISKYWALTSAHCFENADIDETYTIRMRFGSTSILGAEVYFHPNAWPDNETLWTTPRSTNSVVDAFDIALVRLDGQISNEAMAKLWYPNPWNQPVGGHTLTIGGHNGTWGQQASGTQTVSNLVASGAGHLLRATSAPSGAQSGDSGGGAFLTIANGLSASISYGCSPPLAGPNEQALVGIAQSCESTASSGCAGSNVDLYVPTYTPDVFKWIISLVGDLDKDGICDTVDNCPAVQNPDQDNCNALAEATASFEGSGAAYGDACDPVPCTYAVPQVSAFSASGVSAPFHQGDYFGVQYYGREIADEIDLVPAKNTDHAGSTAYYRTRFCFCRDANGDAIDDPNICAAAPFHCTLDPLQIFDSVVEVGGGQAPSLGQTYWHEITVDHGSGNLETGAQITVPYNAGTETFTWAYQADYNSWVSSGFVPAAAPDATYGNGTDLAGAFWTTSGSKIGAGAHGLTTDADGCGLNLGGSPYPDENCSMSHHFDFAIVPDRRTVDINAQKLPQYEPAPWWTFCATCGDLVNVFEERVSNPAPILTLDRSSFVTSWTTRGTQMVTDLLTNALIDNLTNDTLIALAPSEPMAMTLDPQLPRAMFLASDGTRVEGGVTRRLGTFDFEVMRDGVDRRAFATSGFGAAYSRFSGAVYVAGGIDRRGVVQATVRTYRPGSGWSSVALRDRRLVPTRAVASVFSPRDGRLWVVEATSSRRASRRLLRIDPTTGDVDVATFAALGYTDDVFLTTTEDGRVVLSKNQRRSHTIDLLDVEPFRTRGVVSVVASRIAPYRLALAPVVNGGALTLAIEQASAQGGIDITPERIDVEQL